MDQKKSSWSVVRTCFTDLKKMFTVDESLLDDLMKEGVLSVKEYEKIVGQNPEKQINQLLRKVLPAKDDDHLFDVFLTYLRDHKKADIAGLLKEKLANSQDAVSLQVNDESLSAAAIISQSLHELGESCRRNGIDTKGFQSLSQYRDALLDYLLSRRQEKAKIEKRDTTESTRFDELRRNFHEKRHDLIELCEIVQATKSSLEKELAKMDLSKMTFWLEPNVYTELKAKIRNQKPKLLVAGGTSAGKSTLINTLLGKAVLPTSYNAATSALCEIQYSEDEKKTACVTIQEDDGEAVKKTLNLDTPEGMKQLAGYLSYDRANPKSYVCKAAVINWPASILKGVTIVDSPGVTESSSFSSARKITEAFQDKCASGFLYVLDARRSAEEAGQVGGLLSIVANEISSAVKGIVFVINKWDLFTERHPDEAKQDEYKRLIEKQIRLRLKFFRPDQIVTMNAKLAFKLRCLDNFSDDFANAERVVTKIMPLGLDSVLMDALSCIDKETDGILECALNVRSQKTLSKSACTQRQKAHRSTLQRFQESIATGELSRVRKHTEEKLAKLAKKLTMYLQSLDGYIFALYSKEVNEGIREDADPAEIAQERFYQTVKSYKGVKKLEEYVEKEVKPISELYWLKLRRLKASLTDFQHFRVCTNDDEQRGVLSAIAYTLGSLAITTMKMTKSVTLHAWASLASKLTLKPQGITEMQVVTAEGKEYHKLVRSYCEHGTDKVLDVLRFAVLNIPALNMLYRGIPNLINDIDLHLSVVRKVDVSVAEDVITKFQEVRQRFAMFRLKLSMHRCVSADIAELREGPCDKNLVKVAEMPGVYLKEVRCAGERNEFALVLEEINALKALRSPHLLDFFGSYLIEAQPLKVGLLFEFSEHWSSCACEIVSKNEGSVGSSCKSIDEWQNVTKIAIGVLLGLEYLHNQKVVHGRLIAENIWICKTAAERKIKLGEAKARYYFSTANASVYDAPEIQHGKAYTFASDVFSFGVLLWELWNSRRATKSDAKREFPCQEDLTHIAVVARKLYDACCCADVSRRVAVKEALITIDNTYV